MLIEVVAFDRHLSKFDDRHLNKKKQNPKIICNSITTEEENKSNESARELEQKKAI